MTGQTVPFHEGLWYVTGVFSTPRRPTASRIAESSGQNGQQ